MDQKQIVKQIIDFNQATFNNTFNAMVLLQDQFERITQTAMGQATPGDIVLLSPKGTRLWRIGWKPTRPAAISSKNMWMTVIKSLNNILPADSLQMLSGRGDQAQPPNLPPGRAFYFQPRLTKCRR